MYDVVIIGAGTAGLSARREIAKKTDNYLVIDDGPLGTTCARVGCMPSKVLIQAANDFHRRHSLSQMGIHGSDQLRVDGAEVMQHVRKLRDRFVKGVISGMESWKDDYLLRGRARFIGPGELQVGDKKITAKKIIIATGSQPFSPDPWKRIGDRLLDSDAIFEMESLPKSVAVIGLGVIGIELGQALARLGVEVQGFSLGKRLGGLTDSELQEQVFDDMTKEFPIWPKGVRELEKVDGGVKVHFGESNKTITVEKVLSAVGRKARLPDLGLADIGLQLNAQGVPDFDPGTGKVDGASIWIAGDVSQQRPLLHEAADEGRIAGYNAVADEPQCFAKRARIAVTFSDPNIATVGRTLKTIREEQIDYVTGKVSYTGQGRAIVKLNEKGALHVYADQHSGKLLGAEIYAPSGEHLAHLLAWALAAKMTVKEMLAMPFYHPVIEEGLRTALRSAASQLDTGPSQLELLRCQDAPAGGVE